MPNSTYIIEGVEGKIMKINTKSLVIKSNEVLFGEQIICNVLIPYVSVPNPGVLGYEYVMADFKNYHGYVSVIHGNYSAMRELSTLEDKKVLTGNINVVGDLNRFVSDITVESCIALFDKVTLDIDISKSNMNIVNYEENKLPPIDITYTCGKYHIGRKTFKELSEKNIIDAMTSFTKIYDGTNRNSKYGLVKLDDGFLHEITLVNDINEVTAKQVEHFRKKALITWKCKLDTSGSVKKKSDIVKYLNIGDGYVAIPYSIIKKLSVGEEPNCLDYKPALSKEDSISQPINLGTSNKLFIGDLVAVGFTRKYVEGLF